MIGFKCLSRAFRRMYVAVAAQLAIIRREWVVEHYVRSGALFGEALSHLYMGECVGFHSMKERWAKLERVYAELGYRTIPLEDFVEYGGYGKSIDHLVRVRRTENEEAVMHAVTFQERYEQGIMPTLDHPHEGAPTPRVCDDDSKKNKKQRGCDCDRNGPKGK
jgi:hypothetical protein